MAILHPKNGHFEVQTAILRSLMTLTGSRDWHGGPLYHWTTVPLYDCTTGPPYTSTMYIFGFGLGLRPGQNPLRPCSGSQKGEKKHPKRLPWQPVLWPFWTLKMAVLAACFARGFDLQNHVQNTCTLQCVPGAQTRL